MNANAYTVSNTTLNGAKVNELLPYSTPFGQTTATDNSNFAYNIRQLQLGLRLQF
ncbi:hypothetical protein HNQ77_004875 [Silvibacterium bohemicum]|uniref:Uncharacterized protein n=1 Tax=Silvibacterium bohemicum TaxID=1577686 RepID=A0A841K9C6_9BACT|nr:hypothetical protein [Silvibacterium bohemicum]MBB6146894.1 hypothetical protein [Silvibacterium bohemicum]